MLHSGKAKEGKHDEEEKSRLKAKHALDKCACSCAALPVLAFCAAHDNAMFDDAAAQVLEVLVDAGCRFDTSVKTGSSTLVRRPFLPTANFRI